MSVNNQERDQAGLWGACLSSGLKRLLEAHAIRQGISHKTNYRRNSLLSVDCRNVMLYDVERTLKRAGYARTIGSDAGRQQVTRDRALGLGAKDTLNRVLNNRDGRRVAVIVNDMSEVNIDADLVRADTELSRTDETLVEMSNGCICCTLRDDLLAEVRRLAGKAGSITC